MMTIMLPIAASIGSDLTYSEAAYYTPDLGTLRNGHDDHEQVNAWAESYVDLTQRGYTYNDLLDRLDGSQWTVDGAIRTLDLPTSYSHPVALRIKAILRNVASECREVAIAA